MRRIGTGALAGVLLAVGTAAGGVELGGLYMDELRGFSLRPPAGAEMRRKFTTVSWSHVDAKTGAIRHTVTVQVADDRKGNADIRSYAKGLSATLQSEQGFRVASTEIVTVAGKQAVDIRGTRAASDASGTAVRFYQRQVWVRTEPAHYVIVLITGPTDGERDLNATLDAVLGSLVLNDRHAAIERRRRDLQRGFELLEAMTPQKLAAAVRPGLHWFLMQEKGRYVGFLRQEEKLTRHDGRDGVLATSWVMIERPGDQLRLMKRVRFGTADRSFDRWVEQLQLGSGDNSYVRVDDGVQKDGQLVSTYWQTRPGQTQTRKPRAYAPRKVLKEYLPASLSPLVTRTVDLSKPQSYAFWSYVTGANDFSLRTLAIIGPGKIQMGGREVAVIRATDQTNEHAAPARVYLDGSGVLLRLEDPSGFAMAKTTRAEVLRKFPKADAVVRAMADWAKMK